MPGNEAVEGARHYPRYMAYNSGKKVQVPPGVKLTYQKQ